MTPAFVCHEKRRTSGVGQGATPPPPPPPPPPRSSASSRSVRSSGSVPFNVQAWLQLLRSQISALIAHRVGSQLKKAVEGSKRSCNGFPCMYTHLGAKAGKQARMMSLMSILSNCARDPSCSPGKRRRRSATARQVLSMLTQRRTTTS
ncbi:uncharacterized protein LOC143301567 [Babylonia areolata]|uniref:uncharacterized protein LOC143301567 n=1 Tax=Babylonia areolata TaxID=304850 RepID=UPI003FD0E4E9